MHFLPHLLYDSGSSGKGPPFLHHGIQIVTGPLGHTLKQILTEIFPKQLTEPPGTGNAQQPPPRASQTSPAQPEKMKGSEQKAVMAISR